MIVPSDTMRLPLFIYRVPVIPAPSLKVNVVSTKVLPLPVTDLFKVPDKFRVPLLTIVDIFSALVVVSPAFVKVLTIPLFVNVP